MEYTVEQIPNALLDILKDCEDVPIKVKDIYNNIGEKCPQFNKQSSYDNINFTKTISEINTTYKNIHLINNGIDPYLVYTKKPITSFLASNNNIFNIGNVSNIQNIDNIIENINTEYYNKVVVDYYRLLENYDLLNKSNNILKDKLSEMMNENKSQIEMIKKDMNFHKAKNLEFTDKIINLQSDLEKNNSTTLNYIFTEVKKASFAFLVGAVTSYFLF